jgi:hypothetical protein
MYQQLYQRFKSPFLLLLAKTYGTRIFIGYCGGRDRDRTGDPLLAKHQTRLHPLYLSLQLLPERLRGRSNSVASSEQTQRRSRRRNRQEIPRALPANRELHCTVRGRPPSDLRASMLAETFLSQPKPSKAWVRRRDSNQMILRTPGQSLCPILCLPANPTNYQPLRYE